MNWVLKYFENIIDLKGIVDVTSNYSNILSVSNIISQVVNSENSINYSKNLKKDFNQLLNISLGLKNVNGAALYLFDRKKNYFDLLLSVGQEGNNQSYLTNISVKSDFINQISEENSDIVFSNPSRLHYRDEYSNIVHVTAFPIRLKGVFLGFQIFESSNEMEIGSARHNSLIGLNEILVNILTVFLQELVVENRGNLFRAFFEINEIISIPHDKSDIFELLCEIFPRIFNCDRISFVSFDLKNRKVKVERIVGILDGVQDNQIVETLSYLQQAIISSKNPFFVENIESDSAYGLRYMVDGIEKYNLRSLIICPIIAKGRVIGAYQMEFKEEGKAREDFLALFLKLGYIIGGVIEKVHLYRKMEKMATVDYLTGLFLKREMIKVLYKEIIRSRRNRQPLAFLMIDVDKFKTINDTYGHLAGDQVLKKVASVIKSSIREIDVGCRFAGDEFCVLLLNNTEEQALVSAERIRKNVKNVPIIFGKKRINVTLSVGVAVLNNADNGYKTLIERADMAMYFGRKGGVRDISTTYKPSMIQDDMNKLKKNNNR